MSGTLLTTPATIRILYSCTLCGLQKVGVDVRERGASEELAYWVHRVVPVAVHRDHSLRSPSCALKVINDVYIPISGVNRIGEAPKQ